MSNTWIKRPHILSGGQVPHILNHCMASPNQWFNDRRGLFPSKMQGVKARSIDKHCGLLQENPSTQRVHFTSLTNRVSRPPKALRLWLSSILCLLCPAHTHQQHYHRQFYRVRFIVPWMHLTSSLPSLYRRPCSAKLANKQCSRNHFLPSPLRLVTTW